MMRFRDARLALWPLLPALGELGFGLGLGLAGLPAAADTSPYYIGASETYKHESNLLRLADDQVAPAGYSRSDTVSTTSLLAGFDQPFGRQHAYADLSLSKYRYHINSIYDNQSYAAKAGLDWSTANRISGTVTGSVSRSLLSFNNYYQADVVRQRNLQTLSVFDAKAYLGLVTQYSLFVDVGRTRVSDSLDIANAKALDFDQTNYSVGLRWAPRSATTLSLGLGQNIGKYPNYLQTSTGYLSDQFKVNRVDLTANLVPTGASVVDARVSYSQTHYDQNAQRDFSGVTGTLGWRWQPEGRLVLNTRLIRDTGQSSYGVSYFGIDAASDNAQVSNTARLQADYSLTGKTTATAAWQVVDRRIVNTFINSIQPIQSSGRDRSSVVSAGLRWTPLRSVLAGCSVSRERRSASGAITTPLNDSSVSCFGQFELQR